MLRQDATLQGVALLLRHRAHVQQVSRLLVHGLLQLASIDQPDVGDGRPRRLPRILVVEPPFERAQNLRPVIVERACGAFSDDQSRRDRDSHVRGGTLSGVAPL
jgi:hypothetical protein